MNTLVVPKTFELSRVKWEIKVKSDGEYSIDNVSRSLLGECNIDHTTINICLLSDKTPVKYDKVINTYYHELVHALLETLDRVDLTHDEVLVTGLGSLLMEYDLTKNGENIILFKQMELEL